jgi:hypothetical protein
VARYERNYTGERLTEFIGLHVTPTERAELEAAAELTGAPKLNAFLRELLFRRLKRVGAARTYRNPEAAALVRSLDAAAHADNAVGNLLNQIARHLHTTGGDPTDREALREALALNRKAAKLYIAALERAITL